ncbi:hypothetical protein BKA69DRAFT_1125989 [Paraphysoderma sedebokerense]|nr:hypothetical protein BKA69DRAFT_1125989 [Paraphysoderma sedebokerense]
MRLTPRRTFIALSINLSSPIADKMSQLPIDILLIIPGFLSNHDLKSIRLVHSIFNDSCSRILFRSIKFKASKLEKWASSKNNRWEELNACSFLPYVRSMEIFGRGTHELSLILSELLDSRLVNVEEIKFIRPSSFDFDDYRMQYYLPATIKKLTFQRYRSIPLRPYPENLEELSVPNYCDYEPLQLLPPKMKRLCLANCNMESLPPLPQSLRYLDVRLEDSS